MTRPMVLRRRLWLLLTLFIIYGGTIPFDFTTDPAVVRTKLSRVRLDVRISPDTGQRISAADVAQNVVLFVPFGVLGVLADRGTRRSHPGRILVVSGWGMVLAVTVECLQLFTENRTVSLTDVVSDSGGALLGAVAAFVGRQTVARTRQPPVAATKVQSAAYTFGLATLLVLVAAWQPFDFSIDLRLIAYKIRLLQRDAWQFAGLRSEGIAALQYALLAAAACAWAKALGLRQAAISATLIGIATLIALEAGQIFVSSRMPGLEDAVIGATGVALGVAWWSAKGRLSNRWWFGMLVAATVAGAAVQTLSPLSAAPPYGATFWIPFRGDHENVAMAAISHVMEQTLVYMPIGFCAVLISSRRTRALAVAVAIVFLIAGSIELAEGTLAGRYADVGTVVFGVLGCWLGGQLADLVRRMLVGTRALPDAASRAPRPCHPA